MARYLTLRLPFGPAPTEAAIGGYGHDHSFRALHRVYSVGATFGCEKRCFHRFETGGEPSPSRVASSCQLSPHWLEASGSEIEYEYEYENTEIPVIMTRNVGNDEQRKGGYGG